jgi:hypothetical protein
MTIVVVMIKLMTTRIMVMKIMTTKLKNYVNDDATDEEEKSL